MCILHICWAEQVVDVVDRVIAMTEPDIAANYDKQLVTEQATAKFVEDTGAPTPLSSRVACFVSPVILQSIYYAFTIFRNLSPEVLNLYWNSLSFRGGFNVSIRIFCKRIARYSNHRSPCTSHTCLSRSRERVASAKHHAPGHRGAARTVQRAATEALVAALRRGVAAVPLHPRGVP